MATINERVLEFIKSRPEEGANRAETFAALGLSKNTGKNTFTELHKDGLITWDILPGEHSRRYFPANKSNGQTRHDGIKDERIFTGATARTVYVYLAENKQGASQRDIMAALKLKSNDVVNAIRAIKSKDLVKWIVHPNENGKGRYYQYYAAKHAPPEATAIIHTRRAKPTETSAASNGRAILDPVADAAMDSVSILAAEREVYKNALEQIQQLITNALKGH